MFKNFTGRRVILIIFKIFRYEFTGNSVVRETEKEFRKRFNPVEVTLESVYESIKDLDLDNWENKRIQRPWEE